MDGYLTVVEIAKQADVSGAAVCDWIGRGILKAEKFGRAWAIRTEDFDAFFVEYEERRRKRLYKAVWVRVGPDIKIAVAEAAKASNLRISDWARNAITNQLEREGVEVNDNG